jgi:hypothetical protein
MIQQKIEKYTFMNISLKSQFIDLHCFLTIFDCMLVEVQFIVTECPIAAKIMILELETIDTYNVFEPHLCNFSSSI